LVAVEVQEVDEDFREKVEEYADESEYESTLRACEENVIIFAEKMLGLELYA